MNHREFDREEYCDFMRLVDRVVERAGLEGLAAVRDALEPEAYEDATKCMPAKVLLGSLDEDTARVAWVFAYATLLTAIGKLTGDLK